MRFPLESIEPTLRLENLALVKVIHQHRPWRMAVHPNTSLGMRPNTGCPSPGIRSRSIPPIRNLDPPNLGIEEVVDNVHSLPRPFGELGQPHGPVDCARGEGRVVEWLEGCFPEVGKFIVYVGNFGLLGPCVEEGDQSGVVGYELPQCRPGIERPFVWIAASDVGVRYDATLVERFVKFRNVETVAVGEQDGDHFLGVLVEPLFDYLEIIRDQAGVFHEAIGVTQTELAERVAVRLRLQEADTCVELGRDIDVVIVHGKDANERGIVGSDVRDIGVFAIAELLPAVASDLR